MQQYYECIKTATTQLRQIPQTVPLCCGPGVLRFVPPELSDLFAERHQAVTVEMIELSDIECGRYVLEDVSHFGLLGYFGSVRDQGFRYSSIMTFPTYLLVHKGHRFEQMRRVSLRELEGERILIPGKESRLPEFLGDAVKPFGYIPLLRVVSEDVIQQCALVRRGEGVLLCTRQLYEEISPKGLVLIPLEEPTLDFNIGFAFRSFEHLDKSSRLFIEFFSERLENVHEKSQAL
jgi:DNA-binding transcriptional LysR family regulator